MPRLSRTSLLVVLSAGLCALGLPLAAGAAAAPAEETGLVRMAHLSPDTPSVDATIDSVSGPGVEVELPAVGYGDLSPYQSLPAGTYTLSARAAGADRATPPVLATSVTVAPGTATTVAAAGSFAELRLAVLADDLTPPPAGSARARVVNAATTGTPLDIVLSGDAARDETTALATDLAFTDSTDPVDVPAGAGALVITGADGTAAELPVDLAAGSVHTVLLLDREGGGLTVRTSLDAAGPGVVPVGGVEAGAGGTADGGLPVGRTALAALSLTALLLALGVRLPRRGPAPPSPASDDRPTMTAPTSRPGGCSRPWLPALRAALLGVAVVAGGVAVVDHPADPVRTVAAAAPPPTPVVLDSPTAQPIAAPVGLRIAAIGVETDLVPIGIDAAGALVPPADVEQAGWFAAGTVPGEVGPAVLAGHVDDRTGPGVFARLAELTAGDQVVVTGSDGRPETFTVTRVTTHPKDDFPTDEVYGPTTGAELRLITCGGTFDRSRRSYPDNVVVHARVR